MRASEAELRADGLLDAGGVDQPVGLERVVAGRRLHGDAHVVGPASTPVTRFFQRRSQRPSSQDAVDQEPLEVELLQVDEGRLLERLCVCWLQVEGVDLVVAGEASGRPTR